LAVTSSVVAGNTSAGAPDIRADRVTLTYSAVGSSTGYTPQVGSGNNLPFGIDPRLGPLQDNGGPTLTRAPFPDSPLLDAGSNSTGLTTDQRGTGFPRVS